MSDSIKDQIELEVMLLREAGITGELAVVPIVNKRCFVPCRKGWCNCFPTVDRKFCVITAEHKKHALDDLNSELQYLNDIVRGMNET